MSPRLGRAATLAVVGLTLLGLGIRWWNIIEARPVCDPPEAADESDCFPLYTSLSDPLYSHLQGRLIAKGEFFVNPFLAIAEPADAPFSERAQAADPTGTIRTSVGDPPLYQLFLGAISVLGFESGQSHRLWSAVAGVSVVPLAALLALRLSGRAAAVIAAAVAAVHPLLWINDGMLLSEAIYAPLVGAVLLAVYRYRDRPVPHRAAVLGLLAALAALARGEAIMALPLVVLPAVLWTPELPWRDRFARFGVASAAVGSLLIPWNLWLNTQFERPVLMTAASGSVLSASSCDEHFYGRPLALFIYCAVDVDIPPGVDEAEQDALVREASMEYISDNLGRLPVVMAARIGRMWDLYGPRENLDMNIGVEDRGRRPSEVGLLVYYALLPFAAAGVASMKRRGELVWPFAAIGGIVTMTAALTFGLTRYRVPADFALVVLGAVGAAAVGHLIRSRLRPAEPADAGDETEWTTTAG